jgi:hypothetical protein
MKDAMQYIDIILDVLIYTLRELSFYPFPGRIFTHSGLPAESLLRTRGRGSSASCCLLMLTLELTPECESCLRVGKNSS